MTRKVLLRRWEYNEFVPEEKKCLAPTRRRLSCMEMRRLQRNFRQDFIPSVKMVNNTIYSVVIVVLQEFWQLWHGGRIERLSKFNARNCWPDLMNNDIKRLQLTIWRKSWKKKWITSFFYRWRSLQNISEHFLSSNFRSPNSLKNSMCVEQNDRQ